MYGLRGGLIAVLKLTQVIRIITVRLLIILNRSLQQVQAFLAPWETQE